MRTTTKSYDNLNRLTAISSQPAAGAAVSFAYGYNSANQRTNVTLAGGSYWVYQYDALGQVTSGKKYWSNGDLVAGQQFGYGFDDIGNRTAKTANGRQENYTANNLNQYTQRTVPGAVDLIGSAASNATVTVNLQPVTRQGEYFHKAFALANTTSAVYSQLTITAVLRNAATNNLDIVSEESGHAFVPKTPEPFSHDADGNLTADGRWTYTWDGENRLIAMETSASVTSVLSVARQKLLFGYDSQSRRISKVVSNWNGSAWAEAENLRFLYDGWNLLAEVGPTGSVVRAYVWGSDLSGSMQGAGGIGGLLALTAYPSAQTHFVAYDGNGNVGALVDASTGLASAQYEYGPFGETIRATGAAATLNAFRFSTKYEDAETGLLYYGYRYYQPSTGRWLNRDPIEERGGLNLYTFVSNDPLNLGDLLGLVELEFNAFIPGSLGQTVQGTLEIGGANITGTWIREPDPSSPWWFGTDNRGFGGGGTARLRSSSRDIKPEEVGNLESSKSIFKTLSSPSKRIRKSPLLGNIQDPNPLLEFQTKSATPSQSVKVKDVDACTSEITVKAVGSYPFIKVAPNIDYNVTWTLKRSDKSVDVSVKGSHNKFPAYEALVDGNNIYQFSPSGTGPTLWNLGFQVEKFNAGP